MENEPVAGICAEDLMHYRDLACQYPIKSLLPVLFRYIKIQIR
jgi:hypothetical protein